MRKAILLVLTALLLIPGAAKAEKAIRVGVAPFAVYSQEDLGYLSQGLQEMVGNHLMQRGVEVVSQPEVAAAMKSLGLTQVDEDGARRLGLALQLDYVLIGSLTKVGQSLSLDGRIVDAIGLKKTTAVFAQGEGLENLAAAAEDLVKDAAVAISGRQKIAQVKVQGNERIEPDAITSVIKSQTGDIFSPDTVSEDLKRVYGMNFFDDVKVDVSDSPDGKVITFIVDEKPSIQAVNFNGNRMLETEDLFAALGYSLYSIVDEAKLVDSIENLKAKYREKGYFNAEITKKMEDIGPKRVSVTYDIVEHGRVYVQEISFEGNEQVSDRTLRKQLETSTEGWLSWLTDSGILKQDVLRNDLSSLSSYYYNHGYIKAKVGDPDVELRDDGLYVKVPIEEGPQYKVGEVQVTGDLIVPVEEIQEKLDVDNEEYFNRDLLRKDVQTISTIYADHGFAFAAVSPQVHENEEEKTVDVNYTVEKRQLVYFERISIIGNTKTRDKVIRRELKVREGDLFSASGLKKSNINLQRLGYFESINLTNSKGSAEDRINLDVEVKERPTGAFSVGVGYSSFNSVFGMAKISQENLFGTGRHVSVQATLGGKSTEYALSFTEPWLFDIPLAAGFDIFNRQVDYDDYDKESAGFDIRAGYPVWEDTRLSGRYMFEDITVTNVTEDASAVIKEMAGDSSTSSILTQIERDTRNRYFNPTEGSDNSFSVEYAGGFLGGTNYFTRYIADSGWYLPLWWKEHVFFVRGKIGLVQQRDGGNLPSYEKFSLGGLNSVRGYEWGSISPKDPVTGTKLGGEKMLLFNVEYIFPLIKDSGLVGLFFLDQGNVWTDDEEYNVGDLRMSYGAGVRWYSPLGPLRLEWGKVVDPRDGEPESNWEFSVGGFF